MRRGEERRGEERRGEDCIYGFKLMLPRSETKSENMSENLRSVSFAFHSIHRTKKY